MKKLIITIIIVVIIYGVYNIPNYLPSRETVFVDRVIDGDTIETSIGTVRLLGINTPETNESYYDESTQELKFLVEGEFVQLEEGSRNKDVYKRLLRYVYLDEVFVNIEMVENGLARKFGHDLKYDEEFSEAEQFAKENKLGIWS